MHEAWTFSDYLLLIIGAILVKNILLTRFLGNCPFLGTSRRMETATGMAMAVVFVMTLSGVITWLVQAYILIPLKLEYLQTIFFILVIAALVQFVEMFLQKSFPALYQALGIFLPLITTNCAVLGVAVINIREDFNLLQTMVFSFASAVGYGFALILFTGIREQLEASSIPEFMKGTAIGLLTAGLLSLSFFGFAGMVD
ncbi:MAG: electron transport complex subunit RsxA [Deltaproteobacteria bacterium]|nr:electron transport complex subunit RsxA [Deltaproteobacteria bacterium]MBW1928363.1 electron transport complex subunit RsxA [Deltaproteobacteria bacterium]MBW2026839.1 electron transport complex subunit RsxA [Deltaproteobacteria bacterium]MBW2126888.1 electron transport complex subunit RsxA [Deltaproteobacteria bacterium]RLB13609.1 MAG: electron transport complex subunit RsxA [Deltaproteobacteria bacterium]